MNSMFFSQNAPPPITGGTGATREFWFNTNTDGFTSTPGNGDIDMAWRKPRRRQPPHPRDLDPIATLIGTLRTTAKHDAAAGTSTWEWIGTWEDLGQPAGVPVTVVNGAYQFRVDMRARHSSSVRNGAGFAESEVQSGPFEVFTGDGHTLIATLSSAHDTHDRPDGLGYWNTYPTGSAGDAVSLAPPSWVQIVGSDQSVDSSYQASDTSIMLRLSIQTPAVVNVGDLNQSFIRMVHNGVVINMNGGGAESGGGGAAIDVVDSTLFGSKDQLTVGGGTVQMGALSIDDFDTNAANAERIKDWINANTGDTLCTADDIAGGGHIALTANDPEVPPSMSFVINNGTAGSLEITPF